MLHVIHISGHFIKETPRHRLQDAAELLTAPRSLSTYNFFQLCIIYCLSMFHAESHSHASIRQWVVAQRMIVNWLEGATRRRGERPVVGPP